MPEQRNNSTHAPMSRLLQKPRDLYGEQVRHSEDLKLYQIIPFSLDDLASTLFLSIEKFSKAHGHFICIESNN